MSARWVISPTHVIVRTMRKTILKLLLLAIAIFAYMPMSASAYERVLFNAGVGYATSSFGDSNWMVSGATTLNGMYFIDCRALGIAEIASTTVSLYTDSSTRSSFNLFDSQSGRLSDNAYTITNTATAYSYTFTPPLWCEGGSVLLGGEQYATRPVRWSFKGDASVDQVPHAWCQGAGSSCSLSEKLGQDIAIIAEGSFSTSTGGGGNSTTTYNFYTATSSPTEAIEQMTTVHLAFALLIVLFLTAIITYTFTYGRSRPT